MPGQPRSTPVTSCRQPGSKSFLHGRAGGVYAAYNRDSARRLCRPLAANLFLETLLAFKASPRTLVRFFLPADFAVGNKKARSGGLGGCWRLSGFDFGIAQCAAQNFADVGLGQLVAEFDKLWHLVAGEVFAAVVNDVFFGKRRVLPYYEDFYDFA